MAALVDGHDGVAAAARLFLTDKRRFGPDPGGRKRNESLMQPAYRGQSYVGGDADGLRTAAASVMGWAWGKRDVAGTLAGENARFHLFRRRG